MESSGEARARDTEEDQTEDTLEVALGSLEPCIRTFWRAPFGGQPAADELSELLVVRGTGNKWFAEDFLDQLRYFAHGSRHLGGACPQSSTWRWTEARTTVFVGPGTRAPPGLFTLPITGRERASYVAILRHPVLRVVSRYWFEVPTRRRCLQL